MNKKAIDTTDQNNLDSEEIKVEQKQFVTRTVKDHDWEMSAEQALKVNYLTKVNRSISVVK